MQITRASRHYVFLCSVTAGLTACTGSNSTYRGGGAAVATTAKSLGLTDDSLAALIQASRAEDSFRLEGSGGSGSSNTNCNLGFPVAPPLGSDSTVNAVTGALALDFGQLGIVYSACGAPPETAGPFFDVAKNTFVAMNLPLVLRKISNVDIAKLYSFRQGVGVVTDLFVKSDQSERPDGVPSDATMYLRVPGDGTWLAVLNAEAGKPRGAAFVAPGGLSQMMYAEVPGTGSGPGGNSGTFLMTAVKNRGATDYANEFSVVSICLRDAQGRIAETSGSTVYRIPAEPLVNLSARKTWSYTDGRSGTSQLSRVIDSFTAKEYAFNYDSSGNLDTVRAAPVSAGAETSAEDPEPILSISYDANGRLASFGSGSRSARLFAYDAMGRVRSVALETDGTNGSKSSKRLLANYCFKSNSEADSNSVVARLIQGRYQAASRSSSDSVESVPRDFTIKTEFKNGTTTVTSSRRPTASGQRETYDTIGRMTGHVSTRNGQWDEPESAVKMSYPTFASGLPSAMEASDRDGIKQKAEISRNLFGQPKKISVDGKVVLEVSEYFDDIIPKSMKTGLGADAIELSASASPFRAQYSRKINGTKEGETRVTYKATADNQFSQFRISELAVRNFRDGSVETSLIADDGTVTRTSAKNNLFTRITSSSGFFKSILSVLGIGTDRESGQGISGADLTTTQSATTSDPQADQGASNTTRASSPEGDVLQGEKFLRAGNVNYDFAPDGGIKAINSIATGVTSSTVSSSAPSGGSSDAVWVHPANCPAQ
jgi:hypothetical protein